MKPAGRNARAARIALTAAVLIVLVLAGCAGAGPPSGLPTFAAATPPPASSPPAATPTGQATPAASLSPTAGEPLVINVTLTDALRMEPAQMTVPAGRPVTFVVTNEGGLEHEFYLGDAAAQAAHETAMQAGGGTMTHDDDHGIGVPPGATKELTFTFPVAGVWLAGCHVTNHYSGGMQATITVTD